MSKEELNKDDFFSEENKAQSNWWKAEKIGDKVKGVVLGDSEGKPFYIKEGKDGFPAQRVFTLQKDDGEVVNVGVKVTSDYLMGRTGTVKIGDTLGFHYLKDIPPKVKSHHPAKSIEVFHRKKVVDEVSAAFND